MDSSTSRGEALHDRNHPPIMTIGHSTRAIGEFLDTLEAHQIELVADIRTIPKSRRNPQFNSDELRKALGDRGIDYVLLPALGGLRHPRKDSVNTGWRNSSFRGYADYMQTAEFDRGLEELIQLSKDRRTVIMCAETVPWRCHRSLVADALSARGIAVEHIMNKGSHRPHAFTSFVKIQDGKVTYPVTDRPEAG
jgi:uncharacterized protein (DUF488 family)